MLRVVRCRVLTLYSLFTPASSHSLQKFPRLIYLLFNVYFTCVLCSFKVHVVQHFEPGNGGNTCIHVQTADSRRVSKVSVHTIVLYTILQVDYTVGILCRLLFIQENEIWNKTNFGRRKEGYQCKEGNSFRLNTNTTRNWELLYYIILPKSHKI